MRTPLFALVLLAAAPPGVRGGPFHVPAVAEEQRQSLDIEIQTFDETLRRAYLRGETGAISAAPLWPALESVERDGASDAEQLRERVMAYHEAGQALSELQAAVRSQAPDPARVERLARDVAARLNAPLLRGSRAEIAQEEIERAVAAYRALRGGEAQARPAARALPAELSESAARLRALLAQGGDSGAIAARASELLEGLQSREDLGELAAGSEYRQALGSLDAGLSRLRSARGVSAEQRAAIERGRERLDSRLAALARSEPASPAPPSQRDAAPSTWDQVTVAFHASLRALLPETADALWQRFLPVPAGADPAQVAAFTRAIAEVTPGFRESFSRVPRSGRHIFGGGFLDCTYWNRAGADPGERAEGERNVHWGAGTPARLLRLAERTSRLPFFPRCSSDASSVYERAWLGGSRFSALSEAVGEGRVIVPKHFPGGPLEVELTENRAVNIPGGFDALAPYIAPFLAVIPMRPAQIMISHATYPDWELNELRPRWPDLPALDCGGCAYPASLSPYILRGFLRDGLQYRGALVADWYDMGAIDAFIAEIAPRLPPALQEMHAQSKDAVVMTLAVYAGINWITGMVHQDAAQPALFRYYSADPEFRRLFDELVAESAALRGLPAPGAGPALDLRAFGARLDVLTHGETDQNEWTDLRSRGGIMTLSFRVDLLNRLRGTRFPNLGQFRAGRDADGAEDAWLAALNADPEFNRQYQSIPWDGPEMRAAFARHLRTLYPGAAGPGV